MPPEKQGKVAKTFRLSERAAEHLRALADELQVTETAAVEDAITHALGTLKRDQAMWRTVPPPRGGSPGRVA